MVVNALTVATKPLGTSLVTKTAKTAFLMCIGILLTKRTKPAAMTTSQQLLLRALQEVGVKEIKGTKHAPEILKYLEWAGFDKLFNDDETAWCSTFVNAMAESLCLERSHKANARSWLEVGEPVQDPQPGDVVIFWRGSPNDWRGHVGIFVSERNGYIYTLGGNQGDQVSVAPYLKQRLLGYRRLRTLEELKHAV